MTDLGERSIERAAAAAGDLSADEALAALVALRDLRARLDAWEPRLIAAARRAGATWEALAPALGVTSRQAAERRYLRLETGGGPAGGTREERVRAVRDRRAGDRAVDQWARANGADLRQLAGQITALTGLGPEAQPSVDRLHAALGDADAATLVPLLADAGGRLPAAHAALADRVAAVTRDTAQVRARTHRRRDPA
jgi:hypothetical protein